MDAQESQSNWPDIRKTLGKPGFCSGEERNRTTYKFPGKLTLRHHARREIRRAPISLFVMTRRTTHRDQRATSLQPDLQGHEFKTDPNLQGHDFSFAGSFTGSHQKPLRIYRVTGLEFRLRFIQRFNSSPPCGVVDGLRAMRKPRWKSQKNGRLFWRCADWQKVA
jgi:hypothetical protein